MPPKLAKSGKKTEGKPLFKNCLQEPYNLTWPQLEKGVNALVLNELRKYLHQCPELKKAKSGGKRKRSKATLSEDSTKSETTSLKKHFFLGVNVVTKRLEKGTLSLVLVCKSAKPSLITQHLIPLCATRSTPAACVSGLSETLSEELGLKSALVFGVSAPPSESGIADFVEKITPKIAPLSVPWLTNDNRHQVKETEKDGDPAHPSTVDEETPVEGPPVHPLHLPTRICINQSTANKKQRKKSRTK